MILVAVTGALVAAACGVVMGQRLRVREAELRTFVPPHLYVSGVRSGELRNRETSPG